MVTIPRSNGPIPPPRKPSKVSPFVGPEQKIATTDDPAVHKIVSELVDDVHERKIVGIAVITYASGGEVVIRYHADAGAVAHVNMAIDNLKADIVRKAYK